LEHVRGPYTISTDPRRLDESAVGRFLARSYWAAGIPADTLRRSLAGSLCFGLFHGTEPIGFCRVVTDRATFAWLCDVWIEEPHRGEGLGQWLVETVVAHPDLQGLRRFLLATRDAHSLYARCGFQAPARPDAFMEIYRPDIYRTTTGSPPPASAGAGAVARAARPSPAPAERTHAEQDLWTKVDGALEAWLAPADPALAAAAAAATQAGLPEIAVSPAQGRFLEVLARATGARRILEIGTLAGYSTIWLARALPADGRLVTLEIDPGRARLARENLERAGLGTRVEVIDGPALGSLTVLRAARADPFDLVFIDADKQSSRAYVENALALSRPGTVVVVDNVVRDGRVIDPDTGDAGVDGVRSMMDWIASHPRLRASALQTVGAKGHDGMLLAVVEDGPPGTGVSG
jgi:predicted O-methyltransferase YrrM/GNAT superfamily N-acetyltransferase